MSQLAFIRKQVFGETQTAFALIAGVRQGTVSRWEKGEFESSRSQLEKIREAALRRGVAWDDAWFFDDALGGQAAPNAGPAT